jgi:hypothetical protein
VSLRLHEATHDTIRDEELVSAKCHSGNDSMEGTLATLDIGYDLTRFRRNYISNLEYVRMSILESEVTSTVLQSKAAALGHRYHQKAEWCLGDARLETLTARSKP